MMVEVLCSILADTPISAFVKMWKELDRPANLVSTLPLYIQLIVVGNKLM